MDASARTPQLLRIERLWKKDKYTIGRLYVDGELWCNSLEDRDRDLHSGMGVGTILAKKVYGETAIPRGTYEVRLTYSPKFARRAWAKKYRGLVPEVEKVKGFSGVRIHPGNSAADTLGCILPGRNTKVGRVTDSTECYYRLMDEVFWPAYESDQAVILDIL